MSDKIIKCRVKSDSTFTDLIGYYLLVTRDKAFYRIVDIEFNTDYKNNIESELDRLRMKYIGFYIGREELDFENESFLDKILPSKEEGVYKPINSNNSSNPPQTTGTGAIPEFSTGAKRDSEGKEDYVETQSFLAERRYAQYMTSKQSTYGRGNWRLGIPIESYEKSLKRHINKYFANKYDNAGLEPDEDHLSAIIFNVMGIIHEEEKLKQNKNNK